MRGLLSFCRTCHALVSTSNTRATTHPVPTDTDHAEHVLKAPARIPATGFTMQSVAKMRK
jgi:hypothetical protein